MKDILQGDIFTMNEIVEETDSTHNISDKYNEPTSPPIPKPRKKLVGDFSGQEITTQLSGEVASQNPRNRRPAFSATSRETHNIAVREKSETNSLEAKTSELKIDGEREVDLGNPNTNNTEHANQRAGSNIDHYGPIQEIGKYREVNSRHLHQSDNPRERRMAVRVHRPNIQTYNSPEKSEHTEKHCDEPAEAPPKRKRLPSTLNLRVHRMYAGGMAPVQGTTFTQSRDDSFVDTSTTYFDNGGKVSLQSENGRHRYLQSRRMSKDDMFITLQAFRHRHQERYYIPPGDGSNSYLHEPPRVHREEIPTLEEIEKWKLWQAVNNNVISAKTKRVVPETLV